MTNFFSIFRSVPAQLTPLQVESLIEEYLRAFDVPGDTPKKDGAQHSISMKSIKNGKKDDTDKKTIEKRGSSCGFDRSASSIRTTRPPDTEDPHTSSPSVQPEEVHKTAFEMSDDKEFEGRALIDVSAGDRGIASVPTLGEYGERQWVLKDEVSSVVPDEELIGRDPSAADWEAVVDPHGKFINDTDNNNGAGSAPAFSSTVSHSQTRPRSTPRRRCTDQPPPIAKIGTDHREVQRYTAVAITCTGEALGHVLANESMKRYFFGLANLCATVSHNFRIFIFICMVKFRYIVVIYS